MIHNFYYGKSGGCTSYVKVLTASGWSNNTQQVTMSGLSTNALVNVSPAPGYGDIYLSNGIIFTGHTDQALIFECTTTPTAAIKINIAVWDNVSAGDVDFTDFCTWADGTDAQIVTMVEAADRGEIDLADYWNIGDERVVHLSAMEATGVDESHAEQDATFVLMNAGGKTLNDAVASGRTECSFIVGMKDSLNEAGIMNSSNRNTGGWESSTRRAWCNNIFYNAIPSTLKPIFKQHLNKTANGGSGATEAVESVDYFAMAAEYEVFGSYTNSSNTYESDLIQFEWYKTAANRIKKRNGTANHWWERSPSASDSYNFCRVYSDGSASDYDAGYDRSLSPFGCI